MQSVKKNIMYNTIYNLLSKIVPFITAPYIARVFGPEVIGVNSFISSIMHYFIIFAALGTGPYGFREIARLRDNVEEKSQAFWEIEIMKICTSSICLLGWCILIIFSDEYKLFYLAMTPTLIATMLDISWFYIGQELMKLITYQGIVMKVLGVVCLFTFIRSKEDLLLHIAIGSLLGVLGSLLMWLYLPRYIVKPRWRQLKLKIHFRETLIYFIPTVASSVYKVLDKTMIGIFSEDGYENGYYEQTTNVMRMLENLTFASVNTVMGARISYMFAQKQHEEIKKKIAHSMDYIFWIGYGCVFGISAIAYNFVPVFYGEGYDEVVRLLYVMAPIVVIIGISNCLGSQYYNPNGLRAKSAKIIIGGSFVNFFLNLLLIPRIGALGATIASIIAELFITILYVKMSNGYMTFGKIYEFSYKKIFAGLVMMFVVMGIGNVKVVPDVLLLVIQIVSGIIVYIGMLKLIKDKMTLEMLDNIRSLIKQNISGKE